MLNNISWPSITNVKKLQCRFFSYKNVLELTKDYKRTIKDSTMDQCLLGFISSVRLWYCCLTAKLLHCFYLCFNHQTFSHSKSIFHCVVNTYNSQTESKVLPRICSKSKSFCSAVSLDCLLWHKEWQEQWWNGRQAVSSIKEPWQ